mmetsp:Transcript_6179/g.20145  ORF Transcript_6179/g.20145 Transcript_6179/m.20145 type:complete len:453 (+) Transcript_6179:1482-2840(+)
MPDSSETTFAPALPPRLRRGRRRSKWHRREPLPPRPKSSSNGVDVVLRLPVRDGPPGVRLAHRLLPLDPGPRRGCFEYDDSLPAGRRRRGMRREESRLRSHRAAARELRGERDGRAQLQRDPATDEARRRLGGAISPRKRRRLPARGRPPVRLRPRRPAHRDVPLQVSAHAAGAPMQGPQAPDLHALQHGPRRQRAGGRLLGAGVARLALLPPGHRAPPRAVARQLARPPVRGPPLQGHRQDRHEAARRVALRPRTPRRRHARHPRHDARGRQGQQVQDDPPAPLGSLALLEGEHSVEGAGAAGARGEHDPPVRQGQGRLVDEHRALQPRTHQARRDGRQDGVQEEPRSVDAVVAQGGAGAAAQLPEGRAVRVDGGGRDDLHADGALARVAQVLAHPVSAAVVQARHEAADPRAGAAQGELRDQHAAESEPAGGAGAHRAGLRQSPRSAVAH